jgi:hypothetical protein
MSTLDVIFLVLGLFGALPFFGVTGPRLFKYARDVTRKRSGLQIAFLILAIAATPTFTLIAISQFEKVGLLVSLAAGLTVLLIWGVVLIDVWKLKLPGRGERIWGAVRTAMLLPAFVFMIVGSMLTNTGMPLWLRPAPFLGGTAIGAGLSVLAMYMNVRHEKREASRSTDEDSTL